MNVKLCCFLVNESYAYELNDGCAAIIDGIIQASKHSKAIKNAVVSMAKYAHMEL